MFTDAFATLDGLQALADKTDSAEIRELADLMKTFVEQTDDRLRKLERPKKPIERV